MSKFEIRGDANKTRKKKKTNDEEAESELPGSYVYSAFWYEADSGEPTNSDSELRYFTCNIIGLVDPEIDGKDRIRVSETQKAKYTQILEDLCPKKALPTPLKRKPASKARAWVQEENIYSRDSQYKTGPRVEASRKRSTVETDMVPR
jgi:hypothetical protein